MSPRTTASPAAAWLVLGCLVATTPAIAVDEGPLPVSPGRRDSTAALAQRCATFHWTSGSAARAVELLVYEIGDAGTAALSSPSGDAAAVDPKSAFHVTLPGAAAGYTLPPGDCLDRGKSYAWMLRTRGADDAGHWSEPSFFSVAAAPSPADLEDALEVLRAHRRSRSPDATDRDAPAALRRTAGPRSARDQAAATTLRRGGDSEARARAPHRLRVTRTTSDATTDAVRAAAAATAPSPGEDASLSVTDNLRLAADSNVFKDGSVFLWDDGDNNTALGRNALGSNTTNGQNSTAIGSNALASNLGSENYGSNNTAVGNHALFKNDYGDLNTAVGHRALFENLGGFYNTGVGANALRYNTGGTNNTAVGKDALRGNTFGVRNSAFGVGTLVANVGGSYNTAVGHTAALGNTHGTHNVALGVEALGSNSIGNRNVAVGNRALWQLNPNDEYGAGNDNIALGHEAGYAIAELAGSFNIHIGHLGLSTDDHVIRIGSSQTATFVAGIHAQPVSDPDFAHPVWVDPSGKLGFQPTSSRRFKEDIRDLGQYSRAILDLRPVAFRYKPRDAGPQAADGERSPLQTGLIAEEVAEVLPSLVRRDGDGEPLGVDYHELIPLLLNELQRQERELAALREEVARLQPRSDRKARGDAAPTARHTRAPARR